MEIRGVTEEHARHRDRPCRGAECRNRDPGVEPPHQFLEHEDRTGNRRVEGSGEPGARPEAHAWTTGSEPWRSTISLRFSGIVRSATPSPGGDFPAAPL